MRPGPQLEHHRCQPQRRDGAGDAPPLVSQFVEGGAHEPPETLVGRPDHRSPLASPTGPCWQSRLALQEFRNFVGAQWPFLSDPGRRVQQDLDIQEYTDPGNPMIPHTLLLGPGLVIYRVYNGYWFWGRPSFYDLWDDLRDLSREIRPGWDPGIARGLGGRRSLRFPCLEQEGRREPGRLRPARGRSAGRGLKRH